MNAAELISQLQAVVNNSAKTSDNSGVHRLPRGEFVLVQAAIDYIVAAEMAAGKSPPLLPQHGLEKLCLQTGQAYFAYAFRPFRGGRGHYFWKKAKQVSGGLSIEDADTPGWKNVRRGSLTNTRVSEDDVIKHLSLGGV